MDDYNLIIEIIGAVIALTYLYFEYKASVWLWWVGIAMSLFYIYIFYTSAFYADAATYLYYLGANIYGLIVWKYKAGKDKYQGNYVAITHWKRKDVPRLMAIFIALFMAISWILYQFTDSPVPIGDAFTTALSIIGMWLLAKKHIEHWLLWIVVNAASAALYAYKGLYPTSILFIVYTIGSIMGYLKWKKEMNAPHQQSI